MTARGDAIARSSAPGISARRLWAGVLVAPAAWVLMEGIGYYVASRSCEPRGNGVHALGAASPRVAEIMLALVLAAAAIAGLATAIGNARRRLDATSERFLAHVGVIGSSLFVLGIVLFALPAVILDLCTQARW